VKSLSGAALFVAMPALLVLYGRTVTAHNAATYSGTEVSLGKAPRTFVRGVLSSIPGSAWRLSERVLGGRISLVAIIFGVVIFVAMLVRWWFAESEAEPQAASPAVNRIGLSSAVVSVVVYASFAIALQAITPKVQTELLEVGFAYTFYAMSSCAVALCIAVGFKAVLTNERYRAWRFLACSAAAAFLLVQCTVNWRLSEAMNQSYVTNRRLTASFDQDVRSDSRCRALEQWAAGSWPAYYEQGMIDGLQVAYQYYFGEPFCKGFVPSG
jgi:hypothetical protein